MILMSLYPQFHFRVMRGHEWKGSYAAIEGVGDEVAYSAYVNALLSGRPRRNDPYSGRDDQANAPQPESLFSIQFVPAYLLALFARAFGLSAATTFILLTPITAAAASLVLFWFLAAVTSDEGVAAAGTIAILCLGTVAGGHGLFAGFFGGEQLYNYLMFLRRYQPAASFPLFLLYFGLVWRALSSPSWKGKLVFAGAAGLVFTSLVFSYVYLWTAIGAWLAGLILLWAIARPDGWRAHLKTLGLVAGISLLSLLPLAWLYGKRAASLDAVQALESSHRPDLWRLPELIALGILILLAYLVRRKIVGSRDLNVLFAVSFALLPLMVFNQQIVTGKSLQPLHYEMFVANYAVLISLVLAIGIVVKRRAGAPIVRRKAVLLLALVAIEWGAYETYVATVRSMELAKGFDEARPAALRVAQLSAGDESPVRKTVLSSDLLAADALPTSTANSVLWAPHMMVFSGVTVAESKERFYQYLYYTGVTPERLENILRNEHEYGFTAGLFGFERTIKGLSLNPKPITKEELSNELKQYGNYCASFTRERAAATQLSFLMTPVDEKRSLANLDRWYERDGGERVGSFSTLR